MIKELLKGVWHFAHTSFGLGGEAITAKERGNPGIMDKGWRFE